MNPFVRHRRPAPRGRRPVRLIASLCLAPALVAGVRVQAAQDERDYVSLVCPHDAYPVVAEIVERFGGSTPFKYPRIRMAGDTGALALFCAGVGPDAPDLAIATRPLDERERARCAGNLVLNVVTAIVGHDASARPLYVMVKADNASVIAGLRQFVAELVNPKTSGPGGYLAAHGLVPLEPAAHEQMRTLLERAVVARAPLRDAGTAVGDVASAESRLRDADAALWRAVRESDDPAAIQTYLDAFPDGLFAHAAASRRAALIERADDTGRSRGSARDRERRRRPSPPPGS